MFVISLNIYQLLPNKKYGIYCPSIKEILYSLILIIITLISTRIISKKKCLDCRNIKDYFKKNTFIRLIFYITFSAFAQEFLFRTFVYDFLDFFKVNNIVTLMIFSGLIFGFSHLPFKDLLFLKFVTIFGLIICLFYYYIPNLILVSFIHAICGVYAGHMGIIRVNGKKQIL